jgi:regulator of replication initiation timing
MTEVTNVRNRLRVIRYCYRQEAQTAISDKIKDADFNNLLAGLNLRLAEIKTQLAECMEENGRLKAKITTLEGTSGERCPKCLKQG